ncbi:MAG: peptide chain release factor N(5)-glutamine methyltransferase [Bdellovibrionales bacterium]|nr:peptide chain release factor N(5)-glutamine methyltransferase [Bdellovibrionales bacterium]
MKILEILQSKDYRLPEGERVWLLSCLLQCGLQEVRLRSSDPVPHPRRVRAWFRRRDLGEPLQRIVGEAPFFGREFFVTGHTLIPRPETETLVEIALREGDLLARSRGRPLRVVDVGTGTGAIAATVALERPGWDVAATEISARAVAVARKNVKRLAARVNLRRGNLLDPVEAGEFDLVLSNPPYLAPGRDKVEPQVRLFEPAMALYPGRESRVPGVSDRGAWLAHRILEACAERRPPTRLTLMELSARVAALLEERWRGDVRVERMWRERDLSGRARYLLVAWKNAQV